MITRTTFFSFFFLSFLPSELILSPSSRCSSPRVISRGSPRVILRLPRNLRWKMRREIAAVSSIAGFPGDTLSCFLFPSDRYITFLSPFLSCTVFVISCVASFLCFVFLLVAFSMFFFFVTASLPHFFFFLFPLYFRGFLLLCLFFLRFLLLTGLYPFFSYPAFFSRVFFPSSLSLFPFFRFLLNRCLLSFFLPSFMYSFFLIHYSLSSSLFLPSFMYSFVLIHYFFRYSFLSLLILFFLFLI